MPVHHWTRVAAGIFHDFHHEWISEIKRALNLLLKGTNYYALAEQVAGGKGPDVLALQHKFDTPSAPRGKPSRGGGTALATKPPKAQYYIKEESKWYADKKKAVTVRHVSGHWVVAVLEIVSPGNKSGRIALADLAEKVQGLLSAGIHASLVDLFPPTRRDPEGIRPVVWDTDDGGIFQFNPAKSLTCVSYRGGPGAEAYVEPVGVGDALPTIPLFLTTDEYVPVPLEATYLAAFEAVPEVWREALTSKDQI